MTYKIKYDELISKAKARGWTRSTAEVYIEMHHIIPKSLGGSDKKENIVALTGQEHYEAHRLLCLSNPNSSALVHAWNMMCSRHKQFVDAEEYAYLRCLYSKFHSEKLKGKVPHNKGKKHTLAARKKMSDTRKGVPSHRKGKKLSEETRVKMSKSKAGVKRKPMSKESKEKMSKTKSGVKRSESAVDSKRKWTYITPMGEFKCSKEAAKAIGIPAITIFYRCKKAIKGYSLTLFIAST
tara:strand:- start:3736 stop:4449 length:714 start_codon:yes stop_codon:yes gene_type:complete